MKQVFSSKVSWGLFGPVLLLLLALGLFRALGGHWLSALPLLAPLGLLVWLLRRTYYEVQASTRQLRVVSGPFVWRVPVSSISRVEATTSPLASPALSLSRLRIHYGRYDSLLVSPANPSGFLTALLHLNPAIRHD